MKPIYIEVEAEVRYWEDATINGVADDKGVMTPFRRGDMWCPVIRLDDGFVMDWPTGMTADIHFKVCDAGLYWLLSEDRQRIAQWAGYYVPGNFLCHGDNGYGDYIIFSVNGEGLIQKYREPEIEWVCECDEVSQRGWKKVEGGAA